MTSNLSQMQQILSQRGQSHLLAQWDRLSSSQQSKLLEQLSSIDWELFDQLVQEEHAEGEDAASLAGLLSRIEPPPALRLQQDHPQFTRATAIAAGEKAIAQGQSAMMIVAGGLGTRLGFDQPKGLFPLGPVSGRTLFQILCEQVLALSRATNKSIPLYIMTSPATHKITEDYLRQQNWFGLPAEDVILFCQGTLWALDIETRKLLLETPDSLFVGPDGHGGMLQAFARSGALVDAKRRGIRFLSYGQIDNPLTAVCDPLLIGSHLLAGSELTTQVVAKSSPAERVGNVVSIDGRLRIIEYIHLPEELARQSDAKGSLRFWAGNVAVHVFDIPFLDRLAREKNALPWHWARKKVPYIDPDGKRIEPTSPNAWRLERFIFDLLPQAQNALVVEAERKEVFAPVKNAASEPTDNRVTSQKLMSDLHKGWLRTAGATVAEEVTVEINPLFARNATELKERIPAGLTVEQDRYFGPAG